ncbi:SDR family NAD(P)-dependent oxidoreductase [Nocardia farcinica]|nr:SDR family NAD(P)-dependent oxidoreductase [Nocardia farcinica]MBF6359370.1 SDR family NAD(P)-dependent oxidoreductase [Nocardia farcinica]
MSDHHTPGTALVIGGASGIGLATARAFTAEGYRVVVADIDEGAARNSAPPRSAWTSPRKIPSPRASRASRVRPRWSIAPDCPCPARSPSRRRRTGRRPSTCASPAASW